MTVTAAELAAYIAALPRLLTEDLTINVSGTLTASFGIERFYGSGFLHIYSPDSDLIIKEQVCFKSCTIPVQMTGVQIQSAPGKSIGAVEVSRCRYVYLHTCYITGDGQCYGVNATGGTNVYMQNCGIQNCGEAVRASTCAVVYPLQNHSISETRYANNDIGASTDGGIIMIAGNTPELLGGKANKKAGGLIIRADGTLL